ncbi:MAG: hypothetical protein ACOH2F_20680 [Cellulomonas sp.]
MAPTFDEDNGPSRLRSLWNAGEVLTAAAADRAALQAALAAAQRDYDAALAARSALLGALAGTQAAYTAAHVKAVGAGWSPSELSDAGLPAPAARHGGVREPVRPPVAPPVAPPVTPPGPAAPAVAPPSPAAVAPSHQDVATRADPRSDWDAEQTANLVSSRSIDNPAWYESMRYSQISPAAAEFTIADLERAPWAGLPNPSGPADLDDTDGPTDGRDQT